MTTRTRRVLFALLAIVVVGAIGVVWAMRSLGLPGLPGERGQLGDAWLTAKVQSQFLADGDVHGSKLVVRTADRVVTLSGPVADERERDQALAIAQTTDGVERVIDRLWVAGEEPVGTAGKRPDDPVLVATVQSRYFEDPELKKQEIAVKAEQGVTTLEGTVGSEAQSQRAVAIAGNVEGVRDVRNQLRLDLAPVASLPPLESEAWKPALDQQITTQIQSKFFTDPLTNGKGIQVRTVEGLVYLSGELASEAERDRAIALARSTEGVRQVDASGLRIQEGPPSGV